MKGTAYFYDDNEYIGVSLEYITKEILFNQICEKKKIDFLIFRYIFIIIIVLQ